MTSYGGNNFNPPALAGRDIPRKRITPGGEISIHPPLRGGTAPAAAALGHFKISIHPPLAGRDRTVRANVLRQPFQSTRPLRGGTTYSTAGA